MGIRIGADVGGTFTDFCLVDTSTGALEVLKVPTTQPDPSEGLITGLLKLMEAEKQGEGDIESFGHGTTLATNMLLEGEGARTALVTTDGFRDLLELRREKRPKLYDLQVDKPPPLVERRLRFELPERTLWDGTVLIEPDLARLQEIARALSVEEVESVAVVFLHSYRNPRNEQIVKQSLARFLPGVYICSSSEIASEFREFERLSTTAVNAFLGPAVNAYLRSFEERLAQLGFGRRAYILQSDGGIVPLSADSVRPVRLIASGPSAGVAGALYVAQHCGISDIITLDMGGTSTDVSIVERGRPRLTNEREVAGWPLKAQAVDLVSVGAGGGSIVRVDAGGLLKVGPESAGSVPGPAAYGRGGSEPTLTDAHVVLGWLNPEQRLGGTIALNPSLASQVVTEKVSKPLGLAIEEAAQGITTVAVARTVQAIRLVSVQRGYDPREFTLVAFGGAGPLHAGSIMRELGMTKALIPLYPGVMCSLGILTCDTRMSFRKSRLLAATPSSAGEIVEIFSGLEEEAKTWLRQQGVLLEEIHLMRSIDGRYEGQNYELPVPFGPSPIEAELDLLTSRFHEEHERAYGYAFPDTPIECVTMTLTVSLPPPKLQLQRLRQRSGTAEAVGVRRVHFQGHGYTPTAIYRRADLSPDTQLVGPAIVEQMDSTTMILAGQRARVDEWGNLHLTEG